MSPDQYTNFSESVVSNILNIIVCCFE